MSSGAESFVKKAEIEKRQQQYAEHLATEGGRLADFLVVGPLYVKHEVLDFEHEKFESLPSTIELHCPACRKIQTFELKNWTAPNSFTARGWCHTAEYRCRNCQRQRQKYMYVWDDNGFRKVGQYPELLEHVDPQLEKGLGDAAKLYRKALRARSFGFGIGALAYLRRIVEDGTDELLNLLKEDQWESWSSEQRDEFERARSTYRYSEKIEYAAHKVLPKEAFASGKNSFATLHDVTSNGIHGKTEQECIDIFDNCNLVFTMTFRMLYQHKQERVAFMKELSALKR